MFSGGECVDGFSPGAGLLPHLRELEHAALGQVVVGVDALQQSLSALVQAQLKQFDRYRCRYSGKQEKQYVSNILVT